MVRAPVTIVVLLLRVYRMLLSPFLGPACRYHPSCSHYAEEAFVEHGLGRGATIAIRRLLRCHPWAPGGFDPVPVNRHRQVAPRF